MTVGPRGLALDPLAAPRPQTTGGAWNLPRNVAPTTPNQTPRRDDDSMLLLLLLLRVDLDLVFVFVFVVVVVMGVMGVMVVLGGEVR